MGTLVSDRAFIAHKLPGTDSGRICSEIIRKRQMPYQSHSVNGQPDISYIPKQNGGTSSCILASLTYQIWQWCLNRDITIVAQHLPGYLCNSRRGVPIAGRLQRLETHARNIPANKSALGSSRNRPFCLSANQPTPSLCELEARPRSRSDGCFFAKLGPPQRLCIPAIYTDWALRQTGHPSTSSKSCDSYPGLENVILVPSAPGAVCGPTTAPPTLPQSADQGTGATPLKDLVLAAWLVSANSSRQTAFRTKLKPFSCPLGVNPQQPVITLLGNSGLAGVYQNKLIQFQHL